MNDDPKPWRFPVTGIARRAHFVGMMEHGQARPGKHLKKQERADYYASAHSHALESSFRYVS